MMDRERLEYELHQLHVAPLDQVMALVDEYVEDLLGGEKPFEGELWSADDVAEYCGYLDRHAARCTLSRKKVKPVIYERVSDDTRPRALYDADEVRAKLKRKEERRPAVPPPRDEAGRFLSTNN